MTIKSYVSATREWRGDLIIARGGGAALLNAREFYLLRYTCKIDKTHEIRFRVLHILYIMLTH